MMNMSQLVNQVPSRNRQELPLSPGQMADNLRKSMSQNNYLTQASKVLSEQQRNRQAK